MEKIDLKTLKLISIIGTALGIIGTMVSGYAESKQNEYEIEQKVEEKIRLYFESGEHHAV